MATVSATYQSGLTIYYTIVNETSLFWNGSGFEAQNDANWLSYALPTTETLPGTYTATVPSNLPAGLYCLVGYRQNGGSPNPNDVPVLFGVMDWDGTNESSSSNEGEFFVFVTDSPPDSVSFGVDNAGEEVDVTFGVR